MITYSEVPQIVITTAEELIAEFHPTLAGCRIGFVFRSQASTSGGKTIHAKTVKAPASIQPLLKEEIDILVTIAVDAFSNYGEEARRALIDHELCHIVEGENGWGTRGHDFEEFSEIMDRYGFWNNSLWGAKPSLEKAIQLQLGILPKQGSVIAINPNVLSQGEETS